MRWQRHVGVHIRYYPPTDEVQHHPVPSGHQPSGMGLDFSFLAKSGIGIDVVDDILIISILVIETGGEKDNSTPIYLLQFTEMRRCEELIFGV